MSLILSTDTTGTAIIKINSRLNDPIYDFNNLYWQPLDGNYNDGVNSGEFQSNLVKRDSFNPNTAQTINNGNCFDNIIAGAGNTALSGANISSILGGTGNTINSGNNHIISGEGNIFNNIVNSTKFQNNNVIFSGKQNKFSGATDYNFVSSILGGSGNTLNLKSLSTNSLNNGYNYNTIINGLSNSIDGNLKFSWIGNGSANTITTVVGGDNSYNYILNGRNNLITSISSGDFNLNSILGGNNNNIVNSKNSAVIGSNLTLNATGYTYVNKLFHDGIIFGNDYNYYSGTTAQNITANHNGKSILILQNTWNVLNGTIPSNKNIYFDLENGYYDGQTLFVLSIPSVATGITTSYTTNVVINTGNTIGRTVLPPFDGFSNFSLIMNNIHGVNNANSFDATRYSGLGIFVWSGTSSAGSWVRSDYFGS